MSDFFAGDPWSRDATERVLALTEAFVCRHAVSEAQRRLLATCLSGLRSSIATDVAQGVPWFWFVHLPLALYTGLTDEEEPALPLAVLSTLLFRGVDALDDLADGDALDDWPGYGPGEVNLAAATVLSALLPLALTEVGAPADRLIAMQQLLAKGLTRMSAGQQCDLALTGSDAPDPVSVEMSVAGKSGEEVALFAALAARLAGSTPREVESAAAFGRALGTGSQLASDCYDLFVEPWSRDLARGTRTLPIALHLARLAGPERPEMLALLDRARTDPSAQAEMRGRMLAAGVLRRCVFAVEIQRIRAMRALDELPLRDPGRTRLRAMADSISFVSKGKESNDEP